MKYLFTTLLTLAVSYAFAQINLEDSTVQVIGFWDNHEKLVYDVSVEKIKINGTDTTSRETIRYEVEITIKDSTENSYLIEWHYKNYQFDTKNEFLQRIAGLAEDLRVLIKTDELGAIQEIANWEEVRDHGKLLINKLKAEFKTLPNRDAIFSQAESLYSSKQAIENSSIQDAQQFYTFHGARYKLGEVLEGKGKVPNLLGGAPFDVDVTVYLDEINEEDNNYIMRASQIIDSKQLTDATYEYLAKMSKDMGGTPIKRTDLKDVSQEILTASRIHGSGWVIYSVQTKTSTSDNSTNVEERVIEIR